MRSNWKNMRAKVGLAAMMTMAGLALAGSALSQDKPANVDAKRLANAATEADSWLSDGRTYNAQRYSPLTQINAGNVDKIGLAWYDELDTYRGVEATPLYADGVLYNISAWNIATAYDARTGKRLWTYDPKVPREMGRYACCEPVARGLALWKGKAIIATLDGRLIALDVTTGKPVWTTATFDPKKAPYTITGAPRVFNGMVVVGNSGGDFGIRGFASAYDADTGKKLWKFYTAPGDPAKGPDHEASDSVMAMAARTWSGDYWKLGGGANPWDSIAYDPKTDLVYLGTGNGSPLSWHYRSGGKGDNLFICSIVALHAKTGTYAWHYQMVPGEDWDYTCTSSIITADLPIAGKQRHVIMQAPKDGYFYILDAATGKFLSAKPIVKVNWATIDKNGKVIANPATHYGVDPVLVYPGPGGAHNWFPMAYSPRTKLAYFPTYQSGMVYALDPIFQPKEFRSNSGWGGYSGDALKKRIALMQEANANEKAWLTAWDPVAQKPAWQVPLPRHGNGGVLVTASDLVIEGTTRQTLGFFDAKTGKILREIPVQSAPVAGPITYRIDGEQYIAVNAGWGGGAAQVERGQGTELPRPAARLLVFKLGGNLELPPLKAAASIPEPPPLTANEATVRRGAALYAQTCAVCHGPGAVGGVKDLRHMTRDTHAAFNAIVLNGIFKAKGMASFADILKQDEADAIHAYLIARANEDWGGVQALSSGSPGPH
jgi:quinohemoprotein ethanol dehydrogenase